MLKLLCRRPFRNWAFITKMSKSGWILACVVHIPSLKVHFWNRVKKIMAVVRGSSRRFKAPGIGIVLLTPGELSSVALYKAVFVEFFSMMLFLFFVLGCKFTLSHKCKTKENAICVCWAHWTSSYLGCWTRLRYIKAGVLFLAVSSFHSLYFHYLEKWRKVSVCSASSPLSFKQQATILSKKLL